MVSLRAIAVGVLSWLMPAAAYESDWKKLPGIVSIVSFDGTTLCGATGTGGIFCATEGLDDKPNWFSVQGDAMSLAVWGDNMWIVNNAGRVFYSKVSVSIPASWVPLNYSLKQITTDGKQICGVTNDNDIFCADKGITSVPNWRQLPGKLKFVDLTDGILYGTAPDDSIWFGMTDGDPSFTRISGGLRQIAFDGELLCGISSDMFAWCADTNLKTNPNWRNIGSGYSYIDVNAGQVYAIAGGMQLTKKWFTLPPSNIVGGGGGVTTPFTGWKRLTGGLTQINFDGVTACGVNAGYEIWCFNTGFDASPNWRRVPGSLKHVVVWGDSLFGVNSADQIFIGRTEGDPQWRKLDGLLKQISTDGKQICGANAQDMIWCADIPTDSNPKWRLIPGSLKHVVVQDGVLMGINSALEIFVGRSKGDPKWIKTNGWLQNLEYDGETMCGTNDGQIWCADDGFTAGTLNWRRLDGSLNYASINAGMMLGVNSNSEIWSRMDL